MKIVGLGTYPIYQPLHGGQKRVSAIERIYAHNGIEYQYIPVYSAKSYPDQPNTGIALSYDTALHDQIEASGYRTDINSDIILSCIEEDILLHFSTGHVRICLRHFSETSVH